MDHIFVRDTIKYADRFQYCRFGRTDISGRDCDLGLLHKRPCFCAQWFVLFAPPLGNTNPFL
jgi:hypothetical protein